ncbi:hypothetical protein LWF15_16035 [Kineosporia rhizophila]|uniref:hypothetical protein n=1 Tax=Kineosporia TaxID=49184 RepID=UPI000AD383FC|nr:MULTISPECIES: hypothetical protein [Kineosporia]MCE0537012.1 hypothetical protein [Kineosporia rhizophila]GLY19155.1 hypothetical protein Kisp01_61690 [Kineosporia sp. NBRC 101677]
MTKEQRLRIIFWSVLGFLGFVRAVLGAMHGNLLGFVIGLLWLGVCGWKAWSEAKKIDEQNLGQVRMRKQPDRPAKTKARRK